MKKTLSIIAALTIAAAIAGCKNSSSSDPFATGEFLTDNAKYDCEEKVMLTLTEHYDDQDSTDILVSLNIDWPKETGKNIVSVNAVRDWIKEHLSFLNEYKKVYDGNMNDANAVAKFYGDSYKERFEATDDFPAPALSFEIEIKKEFENDKCVTFTYMLDQYLGGAHGGRTHYGATFRKSDGKIMTDFLTLKDVNDDGLNNIIKKGLMKYWEIDDEETLYDYTWENSVTKYYAAQPEHSPCFVKDGLLFSYQEYEIAAYAAGAPEFVVPYAEIEKYLTPTAADLLK
ncbi:MAG: DUF3298 domain-containing protein [Bacteroidales bacterium]|nr:DUF3298 domain-containing protein [Bacteroidales bacterium]